MNENKSANQLWKDSGTTLTFKDWLKREKVKWASATGDSRVILNAPLNDSVSRALGQMKDQAGYQTKESGKTVFGINKTALIIAGVLIVSAIAYKILKTKKS